MESNFLYYYQKYLCYLIYIKILIYNKRYKYYIYFLIIDNLLKMNFFIMRKYNKGIIIHKVKI